MTAQRSLFLRWDSETKILDTLFSLVCVRVCVCVHPLSHSSLLTEQEPAHREHDGLLKHDGERVQSHAGNTVSDLLHVLNTSFTTLRLIPPLPPPAVREYRSRFTSEDTVSFCLRVMVGVIILYDYVHPVGAFAKSSKIDVSVDTFTPNFSLAASSTANGLFLFHRWKAASKSSKISRQTA